MMGIFNCLKIIKVKRMIIHFKRVEEIKPEIKKCHFSMSKRFGKKFLDLQNEFNYFSFGPVVGNGYGSEYSIRQSMGKLRQLLVD
jgi:hypothetical protein